MKIGTGRVASALILTLAILACGGGAVLQPPEFSFWGNLPEAVSIVEGTEPPAPLPTSLRTRCRIQTGERLTLIRGGRILGRGQVGELYGGSIPGAGDDRVVFFEAAGLPDSIDVRCNRGWPLPYDPDDDKRTPLIYNQSYNLFVVGPHDVDFADTDTLAMPRTIDLRETISWLLGEGTVSPVEFHRSGVGERGSLAMPDTNAAVAWLEAETDLGMQRLRGPLASPVFVLTCRSSVHRFGPYFSVFYSEDFMERHAVRGELDMILRVDDALYAIVRDGQAESGAWSYVVYRLEDAGRVQRVYTDGSWST